MCRSVTHSLHCVCIHRGAHDPPSRFPLPAQSTHARLISYQGFLNETALNTAEEFTVTTAGRCTVLARGWWSLNVSHAVATAALTVRGVVVSADLSPPVTATAKECDPPGWKGTAPGIATTVASRGACLRAARTLSPTPVPAGVRATRATRLLRTCATMAVQIRGISSIEIASLSSSSFLSPHLFLPLFSLPFKKAHHGVDQERASTTRV
jgi:hypothetical protein